MTPSTPPPFNLPTLIDRIRAATLSSPDRIAVVCGDETITYRELDLRSGALSAVLEHEARGNFVGIGLPRSIDLIVGILAVLKCGGAYIPIDPTYPAARVSSMVESSRIRMVITRPDLLPSLDVVHRIEVDARLPGPVPPLQPHRPSGSDFIYAIFTSGSTGEPKAASVYHHGFSNLIDWYAAELQLGQPDVTLVISSPGFDLTQKNFFAPLVTGGTLVLDHGQIYDIHRISTLLARHRVTTLNCTPSAFYPLVEMSERTSFQDLATLRHVVLGGEPIAISRIRRWLESPACSAGIINTYGPTECTDICAFHRLHAGNLDDFPFVPTGREIPNARISIRDEDLKELPAGDTGELCIEGTGVGGGYLHDPERTSARFSGGLYRTGDLARRLSCGNIEFRGRADHQVKINGFRIELGDIEAALTRHPEIREAIVIAADNRITAHLRGTATLSDVRAHVSNLLPAYMLPAQYHFHSAFPLTPNGKVDRSALRHFSPAEPAARQGDVSGIESRLLSLWSEILGRPVRDPAANIFDLGGTSIHLAIAHARLREMTGRDLSITDFFAHPSIRSQAGFLSPPSPQTTASPVKERASLQRSGFARFQRPVRR